MREGKIGALGAIYRDHRFMRNAPKCQNCAKARYGRDFIREKIPAFANFGADRFVLRRHAADGVGDPALYEPQAVVGSGLITSFREPKSIQRVIKQITRRVASERPACAIRPA